MYRHTSSGASAALARAAARSAARARDARSFDTPNVSVSIHGGGLSQTVLLHEPREEFCRTHTGKAAPLRLRHADIQCGAVESEL